MSRPVALSGVKAGLPAIRTTDPVGYLTSMVIIIPPGERPARGKRDFVSYGRPNFSNKRTRPSVPRRGD